MIDVISLIIASTALITAFFTHIKHSECFGVKIDTRTPKNSNPTTPNINDKMPLLPSEPIDIPKKVEPKRVYL